ncbi:hypothetical protein [Asticcacaulis sp. AC402]|uniref:hypothetical protein n=1 Tax=Asticcacaulis sp. AC402 TaxID=1282361 RepID=UPI0012DEC031|nr:hypothetical protein [Asticcacaulis sp. AC402]
MSEPKIPELLNGMIGARLDEFTVRFASTGLRFSKNIGIREIVFTVETQCDVSSPIEGGAHLGNDIEKMCSHLCKCLEMNINNFDQRSDTKYEITLDCDLKIIISNNFNDKFKETLSVYVKNWPNEGDIGQYFFEFL